MQARNPATRRKTAVLMLTATVATSLFAQGTLTLIGPATRNGSFEDGILSPWETAAGSVSLMQNSSVATHGEWFVDISLTAQGPIVRPSIFIEPAADSNDGRLFALTFDARNETFAFEGIRVSFAALDDNAVVKFTTNAFFALPQQDWQTFQAQYQVPEIWDGGSLSLGLQFESTGAVAGRTYRGYLDNVVLQQVPEPTSLALLFCGGVLLAGQLLRRYRKRQ